MKFLSGRFGKKPAEASAAPAGTANNGAGTSTIDNKGFKLGSPDGPSSPTSNFVFDFGQNGRRQQDADKHSIDEKSMVTANVQGMLTPDGQPTYSSRASSDDYSYKPQKHEFKTYLLKEKYERPWAEDKRLKAPRKGNWIIYGFIFLAIAVAGVINWRAISSIKKHDYCLVLDDSFSSLNTDIWSHAVQIDGFGTGSFDWTTTDDKNAFVDHDGLHIVPTMTDATTSITLDQIHDGFTLNLTNSGDGDSSCTANSSSPTYNSVCSIKSNITTKAIIPPVRSARLTTQGKKSIQYGRVEVTAKLPKGDWLWPAIWMMPEDSVYGPWPLSGEIDIMESRGNARGYPGNGRDLFMSTLHWGPSSKSDAFWRTTHARSQKRTDFSEDYHTYGIEWSKDYLYTYVDDRLQTVLYVDFTKQKNLWSYGQFEGRLENATALNNPWAVSANANAPFDQKFFLILNVAVGSRNGWFPDALGNKPWVDAQGSAASDFLAAQGKWLPTWGKGNDRGMTVKNVKMWQEGKCH